jgi:hypothetical protein
MGPIVPFDKSFVGMRSVDEAALFDFLYRTNICPMFLTEVLADLEKETSGPRPREKIVADVARKTPSAHSYPNMLHSTIAQSSARQVAHNATRGRGEGLHQTWSVGDPRFFRHEPPPAWRRRDRQLSRSEPIVFSAHRNRPRNPHERVARESELSTE